MYATQVEAYKTAQKTSMSDRDVEAAVLTKAALLLKSCQDSWGDEEHATRLDEALRFNQMIWSIFQAELAKPDNPLPRELRENILSLSAFIDRRIFQIMAAPQIDMLNSIISINTNLAAGLRSLI